jgi:putative FmdB family regulatory protein
MPAYDFRCTECEATATIAIRLTEDLTAPVCVNCSVSMVRVYGVAAVTFKGTGWGKDK